MKQSDESARRLEAKIAKHFEELNADGSLDKETRKIQRQEVKYLEKEVLRRAEEWFDGIHSPALDTWLVRERVRNLIEAIMDLKKARKQLEGVK